MILSLLAAAVLLVIPAPQSRPGGSGRRRPLFRGHTEERQRVPLTRTQTRGGAVLLASVAVWVWTGSILAGALTVCAAWALLAASSLRRAPLGTPDAVMLSPTDNRFLPEVLVLFAALLRSGAPIQVALAAVGQAGSGPIGIAFGRAGQQLALGASLDTVGHDLGTDLGQDRVGLILARSMDTGAATAHQLEQLAQECRRDYLAMAQAMAKRAGVRIVLPLGLCLLPAFVALGIVPIVASLLGDVSW